LTIQSFISEQRTLTPLVEVRILVPQPVEIADLLPEQSGDARDQFEDFVLASANFASLAAAFSAIAGSRLR
jgi:hypothetical protein